MVVIFLCSLCNFRIEVSQYLTYSRLLYIVTISIDSAPILYMAYQFAHLSWSPVQRLSRRTMKAVNGMPLRSGGWSARDLANEAERKLGACSHVPVPQPPQIIFGTSVSAAVERAEAWSAKATTASGGKYRKNQPCIAAGVFSCPRDREDIWLDLRNKFISHLVQRHGDRLLSVIQHEDEAHPHVHFYIVPRDGETFGAVHPGYAARTSARSAALTGKLDVPPTPSGKKPRGQQYAVGAAFRSAMASWQDEIYEHVCRDFGFERVGPRRQRVSREEKKRQQEQEALDRRSAKFEALLRQAEADALMAHQIRQAAEAQLRQAEDRAQKVSIFEKRTREEIDAFKALPQSQVLEVLKGEKRARLKAEQEAVVEKRARIKAEQEMADLIEEVERLRCEVEALRSADGDSQ